VQLSARFRGVSPLVIHPLPITEQSILAELHRGPAGLVRLSDQHLYSFQIRGWQFGDPPGQSSLRSSAARLAA